MLCSGVCLCNRDCKLVPRTFQMNMANYMYNSNWLHRRIDERKSYLALFPPQLLFLAGLEQPAVWLRVHSLIRSDNDCIRFEIALKIIQNEKFYCFIFPIFFSCGNKSHQYSASLPCKIILVKKRYSKELKNICQRIILF